MQILRNYSSQAQILGTPNTTLARAATALLVERPVPARGGFWAVLAHFAVFASDLGLCRVYNVLADVRSGTLSMRRQLGRNAFAKDFVSVRTRSFVEGQA